MLHDPCSLHHIIPSVVVAARLLSRPLGMATICGACPALRDLDLDHCTGLGAAGGCTCVRGPGPGSLHGAGAGRWGRVVGTWASVSLRTTARHQYGTDSWRLFTLGPRLLCVRYDGPD